MTSMRRHRTSVIALGLGAALLVAACGESDSEAEDSPVTTTSTTVAVTTIAPTTTAAPATTPAATTAPATSAPPATTSPATTIAPATTTMAPATTVTPTTTTTTTAAPVTVEYCDAAGPLPGTAVLDHSLTLDMMDDGTADDLIEAYDFGALVSINENGAPAASHIPFMLDRAAGDNGTLQAHLARGNPQWRGFDSNTEILCIFEGPHAYISPRWYDPANNAVPTWNYAVVHAYGVPRVIEDSEAVRAQQTAMVARYEDANGEPWRLDSQPEKYIGGMLKGIVAFEIPIARLEGSTEAHAPAVEALRDPLGNRLNGARFDGSFTVPARGLAHLGEEEAQMVEDLGRGAHRRARVGDRVALLDRDGRRQIGDPVDIGPRQPLEELPRIRRERAHITSLTFRVEGVEREGRLARARHARDDRERAQRDATADTREVVRAGILDADLVLDHETTAGLWRLHAPPYSAKRKSVRSFSASERSPSISS